MKTEIETRTVAVWEHASWLIDKDIDKRGILITKHGMADMALFQVKHGRWILSVRIIHDGREHWYTRKHTKPFTRLGAVRIAKKWIRESFAETT